MSAQHRQHVIDPEICIRCYACENSCPIGAIDHDANNVVVDAGKCNFCMDCIGPCPTGAIDSWRTVATAYSLEDQFGWRELPPETEGDLAKPEALDQGVAALVEKAHSGGGGKARAPATAASPTINLYSLARPAKAVVQGNYRLTGEQSETDIRHIILDLGGQPFPVLEGQTVGIIPPGVDGNGKPHLPRLYSVSSPRDGERPNFNNLSLTVKRATGGICSNYICDLQRGDEVQLTGPFGATFLLPSDPKAKIVMICTGTGAAPFRGFTMRRQREQQPGAAPMTLIFGARTAAELPYFGPLKKVPRAVLSQHLAFSREMAQPKRYVQDILRELDEKIAGLMVDPNTYIYICGLRAMEQGVEEALASIAEGVGLAWRDVRDTMRDEGRYHVETYE